MTTPHPPDQPLPDSPQGAAAQPGYPQPGYAQPGYPQPQYTPPAYPQQGYPQGYGQQYAQPGYPQPGYQQQPGQPAEQYGMPAYPGAGYAQPGYGNMPSFPKPAVPSSVSGAFLLWMGVLVVGIISNIVLFSTDYFDKVQSALDQLGIGGSQPDAVMQVGKSVLVAGTVVGIALSVFIYLFFGLKMRGGRNWSRIVLTVLGGIMVLFGAAGNAATSVSDVDVLRPEGSVILSWIAVILAAVAIIAMYLPASNTYFRDSKSYRSTPR